MDNRERLRHMPKKWAQAIVEAGAIADDVTKAIKWACHDRANAQFLPTLSEFTRGLVSFKRLRVERESQQASVKHRLEKQKPSAQQAAASAAARSAALEDAFGSLGVSYEG